MDIHEMHIGLDLLTQRLNSNVFNRILPEEKDWFLNATIKELVRAVLLKEENTVFNIITYSDIRAYYEALQSYIRTLELNIVNTPGEKFVYGDLPYNIPMIETSEGLLYKGISYKVKTFEIGTDFTSVFGIVGSAASIGVTYLCNPANKTSSFTLVIGNIYRIINAGAINLVTSGAAYNKPGTVFTATAATSITDTSIELECIAVAPNWGSGTKSIVTPTTNYGYFNYLSSRSYVVTGQPISSGSLTLNKKYYVAIKGTLNLTSVGGKISSDVGYIFVCTSTTAPEWGTTGTVLYEIVENTNRLVKAQDIYNLLDHSFGSTPSSPLSILADNKLKVYHDFKFEIYRVILDYVKEPISVNYAQNISTDLPISLHNKLVEITAEYIKIKAGLENRPQRPQQSNQD
jgi:hypothetical protein